PAGLHDSSISGQGTSSALATLAACFRSALRIVREIALAAAAILVLLLLLAVALVALARLFVLPLLVLLLLIVLVLPVLTSVLLTHDPVPSRCGRCCVQHPNREKPSVFLHDRFRVPRRQKGGPRGGGPRVVARLEPRRDDVRRAAIAVRQGPDQEW